MPARAKLTTNELTQSTINVDNFAIGDEMSHAEMDSNFLNLRDQTFGIVGDDSTGIDVKAGDTIKFLGQGATSVAIIGNQVVISSTDTGTGGGGVTNMRFVGDDSTGVTISDGETLKITGTQNISVIASQDTVTITGPDLSSYATASSTTTFTNKSGNISQWTNDSGYLTNSPLTIVGDDSTGTTLNTGETLKIAGVGAIETSVSGDTVSLSLSQSATAITIVGDDSTGSTVKFSDTIKFAGAGTVTTSVVNDVVTITGTGGGGSSNLGNLQVNNTTLSPITTNDNLILTANGTGDIQIQTDSDSLLYVGADTADNHFVFLPNSGILRWATSGTTSAFFDHSTGGIIEIKSATDDGDILLTTNSGGQVIVGPTNNIGYVSSNGANDLKLWTNEGTNSGSITITDGANGNITISPNGTGSIVLDGVNWPQADGTTGQILSTNGSGQLSWITNTASTGDIIFTGNNISTGSTNANLELSAAGTGVVHSTEQLFKVGTGSTTAFISSEGNTGLVLASNTTPSTYSGTTNTEAFIEITASGLIVMRTAGDDAIYLECDQLILGKTSAPSYNADCTVTASGHGDLLLTNNSGGSSAPFIKIKKMTSNATADGDIDISPRGGSGSTARINFKTTTQTGIGANGAATALTANPVGYMKVKINDTEYQIPYYNV